VRTGLAGSLDQLIGNTPFLPLHRGVGAGSRGSIFVKLEYLNPGGSVKDRPALAIIQAVEAHPARSRSNFFRLPTWQTR
jgi:cysteine synthase